MFESFLIIKRPKESKHTNIDLDKLIFASTNNGARNTVCLRFFKLNFVVGKALIKDVIIKKGGDRVYLN